MRGPFSGIRTVSDQLTAEGDLVFERWTCTFTHTGEFMGIKPTGRSVRMLGFAQYRLRDGKVVEFWGLSDALSLDGAARGARALTGAAPRPGVMGGACGAAGLVAHSPGDRRPVHRARGPRGGSARLRHLQTNG